MKIGILKTSLLIAALYFLAGAMNSLHAADFYWRENAVSNLFSSSANWVTNPDEVSYADADVTSTPSGFPGPDDHVFFTVASNYTSLTCASPITIKNLIVTAPVAYILDYNMTIYGSVSSNGNFTFAPRSVIRVTFSGSTDATIDWGGVNIGSNTGIIINKKGANVQLVNNHLTMGSVFTLTDCASFLSNGLNINAGNITIASQVNGSRTIDLSTSTLTGINISASNNNQPQCHLVATGASVTVNYSTFKTISITGINNVTLTGTSADIKKVTVDKISGPFSANVNSAVIDTMNVSVKNYYVSVNSPKATIKNLDITSENDVSFQGFSSEKTTVDAASLKIYRNATRNEVSTGVLRLKKAMPIELQSTLSLRSLQLEGYDCANHYTLSNSTVTGAGATYIGTLKNTGNTTINLDHVLMSDIVFDSEGFTLPAYAFTAPNAWDAKGNSGSIEWTESEGVNYYWTGAVNNDWHTSGNWSVKNEQDEKIQSSCVPAGNDNVFFDDDSFPAGGKTVTASRSFACHHFVWEMSDGSKIGSLSAISGYIGGNFNISGANSMKGEIRLIGKVTANPTTYTLKTGGTALQKLYIYPDKANSYALQDALTLNSGYEIYHTSGGFISNGHDITCYRLRSNTPYPTGSTRSLNLAGSTVNTSGTGTSIILSSMKSHDFSDSHFIITHNDGSAGISATSGSFTFNDVTFPYKGTVNFYNATHSFHTLTFESDGNADNGFTVENLVLTPSKTYSFTNRNTPITITGSLEATSGCEIITIKGTSNYPLTLKNGTGTPFEIPGLIAQYLTYVDENNTDVPLSAPGGENQGNNVNVDFIDKIGQTFYWIGGTGNWSESTNWSFNLNGEREADTGGCIPGVADTAIFDEYSFDAANQSVTMDLPDPRLHSLILTPAAALQKPTLANQASITFSGSLDVASGGKISSAFGNKTFTFTGSGKNEENQVIRLGSTIPSYISFSITGSGQFDILSDISSPASFSFANVAGNSLYLHGYDIIAGGVSIDQNADSYVDISNSTLSSSVTLKVGDCEKFIHENANLIGYNNTISITTSCDMHFNSFNANTLTGSITNGAKVLANEILSSNYIVVNAAGYTTPKVQTETYLTVNKSFVADSVKVGSYLTVSESVVAKTVTVGTYLTVDSSNKGYLLVDDLTVGTNINIYNGRTVEINNSLTMNTGNPCRYRSIQGTSSSTKGILKFNYCNPTVSFVEMQYITAQLLDGSDCEEVAQTFTVYGREMAGKNNTNVTFENAPSTGVNEWDERLVACAPTVLDFAMADGSSYQWYTKKGETLQAIPEEKGGTGRYLEVGEDGTYVLHVTYDTEGCISQITQPIVFDADRTWTAQGRENDWNDPENWQPQSVPDICSYVTIPGGLKHYPILDEGDDDKCYIIHFKFGGEVKNTHLLTYTSAKVEMEVNSNQWYMTTAPLKNTYSGDFYATTSNPFTDFPRESEDLTGLMVRTQKFHATNPQYDTYHEYTWTGAFNTNDVELQAGEGIALFANPRKTGWGDQTHNILFAFPKDDEFHYYYDTKTEQAYDRGADLDRSYYGRFIYENEDGEAPEEGLVSILNMNNSTKGEIVLVGNPFMTHLDFISFAERNSDYINKEYKISYGISSVNGELKEPVTYKLLNNKMVTTDPDPQALKNPDLISPLQSFFVTLNSSGSTQLKAHVAETVTNPDPDNNANTLRSTNDAELPLLRIQATMGSHTSNAVVAVFPGASSEYVPEEDSYKLFSSTTSKNLMLYTLSSDNKALDINSIEGFTKKVAVGFRTSVKENFSLSFSGTAYFEELYLLRDGVEYNFAHSSDKLIAVPLKS